MCEICLELGIDDPLVWFNAVDPKVIDLWIAFKTLDLEGKKGNPAEIEAAKLIKNLEARNSG